MVRLASSFAPSDAMDATCSLMTGLSREWGADRCGDSTNVVSDNQTVTIAQLATGVVETVAEARPWLLGLAEPIVRHRPALDRWSIAEVIGHLCDSACNNRQRFIRAQEADELTFPEYEQNSWGERSGYHEFNWTQLVELWHLQNVQIGHVIRMIPEDQLAAPCTITPYKTCALEFLVFDYLDHHKHHLVKIRERV
jgi:hypothetical protein